MNRNSQGYYVLFEYGEGLICRPCLNDSSREGSESQRFNGDILEATKIYKSDSQWREYCQFDCGRKLRDSERISA